MARSDPVARERVTRDGDVDVGLGVETLPTLDARLEQAEVLELARAGGLDSGAVAERFQVEPFLGLTECSAPPPAFLARAGCEFLPDHAQRQELVALHAQDRLERVDVILGEEPVTTLRPLRRKQALILEVADLRD